MTKEDGSESPSRSRSNLQDGADEVQNKPLIRYKRNPRVFSSNDITEKVKSSENSDGDNRKISSTSGFIEAAHDHKPEIIPFKKRSSYTSCQEDDNLDAQSQLTTRESGGKLSPFMSAGEEHCSEEKKITGDEDLVEGGIGISTNIHDDGAHSKNTSQGGRDYNDTAPNVVGDGKQAHNTKHDDIGGALPTDTAVEKSTDGNSEADCHEQVQQVAMKVNSVPEEEGLNNRDKKTAGYFLSLIMDDGDVPDNLIEFESKNGGSGEAGDGEGQQEASMADIGGHGNNTPDANTTAGGEEPMEIDTSEIIHDGGSSIDNPIGYILAQGKQEYSKTIICGRKRSPSTHEQGEVTLTQEGGDGPAEEQARKIFKYGSDHGIANALGPNGGIGGDEPPAQQATRKFRLFGLDISCEPEHHVPMRQPTPGIRLFGVDISGDQVQPAAMGNNDGGSSRNRLPGNDGGHGR